jgi:cation diffusion facilitator family transporter
MSDQQEPRQAEPTDQVPSLPRAFVAGIGSAAADTFGRGPREDVSGSIRTVSVAFLANLVVAIAKYIGFFLSGSSAMLAESVHSTAVTINQALMLQGQLTARRPATRLHPFGFGQIRYFWAFVVSVLIFGIGAVISVGRGVLALAGGEGETLARPYIPLAALTVGLLMDGSSFVVGLRQAKREKGELSYWQYIVRSKNPEVPVVLLEDSAAIVGLFFAYLGVGLTVLTGNGLFDGVASILIGLLLATVSLILAREMKSLLIGEAASPQEEDRIEGVLAGHRATTRVVSLRSLYLGPDDLLVEAKIQMDRELGFDEIAAALDEMEAGVREEVGTARIVAIEPDEPGAGDNPDTR